MYLLEMSALEMVVLRWELEKNNLIATIAGWSVWGVWRCGLLQDLD